jgi:Concanavalin A-like lectin/glucanases superfamily/Domain of unknown function (DUF2341)
MAIMSRYARATAAWLVAIAPFACIVPEIDLAGRPCPCAEGYVCDTTRNTCVPAALASAGSGAGGSGGGTGVGGDAGSGTGTGTGAGTGTGGVIEPGYAFRRKLTFDNSGRDEDLIDFPVLVTLDSTRVRYEAVQPGGADVHFTDAAQSQIPYEIERWDPGGRSFVWVRVPRIAARSASDFIYIYYVNPDVTDGQAPDVVWAGHQAVYHLGDDLDDSSPQHFHGEDAGTGASTGIIGGARQFAGLGQFVDLGQDRPFVTSAPAFTLGVWINPSPGFGEAMIFGASVNSGGASTSESRAQIMLGANATVRGGARTSDLGVLAELAGGPVLDNAWTRAVVVADFAGDSMAVYVNGALAMQDSGLGFGPLSASSASSFTTIGIDEDGSSLPFHGLIDEVTLALVARSPAWISAEYASMRDALITYGPEEAL